MCKVYKHMLKCFNITEPSLDTPLKVKQGVQHDYTQVWGSASASNLLEHFIAEITRLVELFDTCSSLFEFTEASLNTSV